MQSMATRARVLAVLAVLVGAVLVGASPGSALSCDGGPSVAGLVAGATGYSEAGSSEVPAIVGLVVGATGYAYPAGWPPHACSARP